MVLLLCAGEGAVDLVQAAAVHHGLFDAGSLLVQLCNTMLQPSVAQLVRGVALKALCAVTTAFELGPKHQDAASLSSLWDYLSLLLQGTSYGTPCTP